MAPAPDCSRNCRKGMLVALGIATLARAAVRVAEADQGSGLPADSKEASCDAELLDDTDSQKTSLLQQSRAFVLDQGVQRQAAQQAPAPPNSTRAAKVQLYGSSQCQCIGINSEGTMKISVNGTTLDYPRATGSSCQAWDSQRHPDCQSSSSPSWCRSSWCYVDAASCDLRGAQAPEVSLYLQDARFQGRQLYYSYATCGSTDTWTADRHVEACSNQRAEADCGRLSSKCAWTGSMCAGKELVASISGDRAALPEEFGQESCACIGFTSISGSTLAGSYGRRDSVAYSADVGSSCQAWDKSTNSRCSGVADAWWCKQSWCYVDPCTCTSARSVPRKAHLLPGGATFRGVPLFYSYETCGSMDAYSKTMNKESCPRHTSWHACGKAADSCYWHSTMGCVSNVFRESCGVTDQNAGSKTVLAQIYQAARKEKAARPQ
mmetsp:Transcript_114766/g.325536  ORF Transcript_114766/g.325536 Transcript_114766/m.325536 type:complete len:435 (+) Transcript_114766:60-1364(+)